jgi:hypothetical protein
VLAWRRNGCSLLLALEPTAACWRRRRNMGAGAGDYARSVPSGNGVVAMTPLQHVASDATVAAFVPCTLPAPDAINSWIHLCVRCIHSMWRKMHEQQLRQQIFGSSQQPSAGAGAAVWVPAPAAAHAGCQAATEARRPAQSPQGQCRIHAKRSLCFRSLCS